MLVGLFMYAVVGGVCGAFPNHNPWIYFSAVISTTFYIAWILGASSCGFDKLNTFWRAMLSTLFLNGGIIWWLKDNAGLTKPSVQLAIFLTLNILIAAYGSLKFEKYANVPMDKIDSKGNAMALAIFMPIPIIGVAWIFIFGILSLIKL